MAKGDAEEGVTRCVCGYNTDNEGLMIQCDTCRVWQHAECVGVTKSSVPEQYYCFRCMPNHPIHKKPSQSATKAKQPKPKPKPIATPTPSPLAKPLTKVRPSHHGPAEKVVYERPPPRKRVLEPAVAISEELPATKQGLANDVWLKATWDYFEKIRQHNAVVKGFDPPPPPLPLPSCDVHDTDIAPPTDDASQVFQWAGVRPTRRQLKEMGIPVPVVRTSSNPLPRKKKRSDMAPDGNAPRPFVGEQGIPPCADLLMTWPWRDATPLAPYYLGKKRYVMKRVLEEQESEDRKAGGDAALRAFLEPGGKAKLLPLRTRLLRAYRESV